jgi:hypothetical protein
MRTRTTLAAIVSFVAGLAIAYAADSPMMGTWKLNDAKSKFDAGATKNQTVVYAAQDDSVKITVDGTTKDGKAVHNEWVGKFDGKDYPVTGDDNVIDARSYVKADDNTLNMTVKKAGKVVGTGTIKVSSDGKSRTVVTKASDAKNAALNGTAVYDKQ